MTAGEPDRAQIVTAWALGMTPATIVTQFGVTLDDVDRALTEHRERRAGVVMPSSLELKRDALDSLEAQMERLSLLASQTATGQAARVAAVRTWREMWGDRLDLLRELGHVEPAPGTGDRFGVLLRAVLEALRAEEVPQDVLDRVAARVLSGTAAGDLQNVVAIEARPR